MSRLVRSVAAFVLAATMAGCATQGAQPRAIGPDVYELTRRTAASESRADAARVDVELAAAAYCGQQDKALSVLDSRSSVPEPPAYPTATVQFRCVPR